MHKKILGVIGNPIAHSLSPIMHNAALQALQLDTQMEYHPFHVMPKDLAKFIRDIRQNEYVGINVTVPHKITVMEYLDEITKLAKLIGAVNTIKNDGGKLVGYNTDGPGFLEAIKYKLDFTPAGKKIVLLGAGGAARAVAITLAQNQAHQIVIFDVDEQKTEHLSQTIRSNFKTSVIGLPSKNKDLVEFIADCDLLVNATPIGMHPQEKASPLDNLDLLPRQNSDNILYVYDLVYVPKETKFINQASATGAKTSNGLSMLVYQGALAFTIFTGVPAPVGIMEQAAEKALGMTK